MRAEAYIQLKDWNNAMSDLTAAIQNSPNKANYYLARAFVYYKMGRAVLSQEDTEQARFYDSRLPGKINYGE
jgi:Tfp pilus assembly protein PilF